MFLNLVFCRLTSSLQYLCIWGINGCWVDNLVLVWDLAALGPATLGSQPWSRRASSPGLCLECGEERPPFCHMSRCSRSLETSLIVTASSEVLGQLAEQCPPVSDPRRAPPPYKGHTSGVEIVKSPCYLVLSPKL